MVKFIYNVKQNLQSLIKSTIADYDDYSKLVGYVDEGRIGSLEHTSVYLVCEMKYTDTLMVYTNPLAIIAKNDIEAVQLYNDVTSVIGGVLCEMESNCSKLKVEPFQ